MYLSAGGSGRHHLALLSSWAKAVVMLMASLAVYGGHALMVMLMTLW